MACTLHKQHVLCFCPGQLDKVIGCFSAVYVHNATNTYYMMHRNLCQALFAILQRILTYSLRSYMVPMRLP